MGLLDRLLGRRPAPPAPPPPYPYAPAGGHPEVHGGVGPAPAATEDERAVERYRYLLRTAPPEQIEQAHEEAFARLTPQQRRAVLESLMAEAPEYERSTADDPRSLARAATRAEMRSPGTLVRSFGGGGTGMGMGGMGMGGIGMGGLIGGSLLGSVAGAFIGTAIAQEMFDDDFSGGDGADGGEGGGEDYAAGDQGDYGAGADTDAAFAGDDVRYGDSGDFGGGDFGGGDFGGGDFGGGDFGGDF